MRKRFLAGACLAMASAGAQEVVNGGFERDLTDWDTRGDRDMSVVVAEAAHTGQSGVRVTDESEKQGSSVVSLPTEAFPGRQYELSCWGRGVSGTGGVGVYLRFLDEAGKGIGKGKLISVPAEAKEWIRYSVTGAAPEGTVTAVVWIHSFAKDMPVVDLDDFELKDVSAN